MVSIVDLKDRIKGISEPTSEDHTVLAIVDSFWGCPMPYIRENLPRCIEKYKGCSAWEMTIEYLQSI